MAVAAATRVDRRRERIVVGCIVLGAAVAVIVELGE